MRIADEPNIELLRKKAEVLESENERMSKKLVALLRENLKLKGMAEEAVDKNLPGLLEQITSKPSGTTTRSGNEGRPRPKDPNQKKKPQIGHGPTPQPNIEIVHETFDLDEADKVCPQCAKALEEWANADDESDVIESIQRKWIVKRCRQKKYRCPNGCTVVTADGPDKLIKGGRYGIGVAVDAAIDKYDNQIPLQRQVKMARREGVQLTTQALWDQILALAIVLAPLCERIRRHILGEPVIGVDLTGFSLIEKGGSTKKQVWQMSCPTAIYFEMLDTKKADDDKASRLRLASRAREDGYERGRRRSARLPDFQLLRSSPTNAPFEVGGHCFESMGQPENEKLCLESAKSIKDRGHLFALLSICLRERSKRGV